MIHKMGSNGTNLSYTAHLFIVFDNLWSYLQDYKWCWVNAETLLKNKTLYTIISFKSLQTL